MESLFVLLFGLSFIFLQIYLLFLFAYANPKTIEYAVRLFGAVGIVFILYLFSNQILKLDLKFGFDNLEGTFSIVGLGGLFLLLLYRMPLGSLIEHINHISEKDHRKKLNRVIWLMGILFLIIIIVFYSLPSTPKISFPKISEISTNKEINVCDSLKMAIKQADSLENKLSAKLAQNKNNYKSPEITALLLKLQTRKRELNNLKNISDDCESNQDTRIILQTYYQFVNKDLNPKLLKY